MYAALFFLLEVVIGIVSTDIYQRFGTALRVLMPDFAMSDSDIESAIASDGFEYFALNSGQDIVEIIEVSLLISQIRAAKGVS
jgi:hypothetical protein